MKGLLFVVSAPAGCGKDTILNELFKKTDTAGYAVSATTRAPREGEINGVHYHFLHRQFLLLLYGLQDLRTYSHHNPVCVHP